MDILFEDILFLIILLVGLNGLVIGSWFLEKPIFEDIVNKKWFSWKRVFLVMGIVNAIIILVFFLGRCSSG